MRAVHLVNVHLRLLLFLTSFGHGGVVVAISGSFSRLGCRLGLVQDGLSKGKQSFLLLDDIASEQDGGLMLGNLLLLGKLLIEPATSAVSTVNNVLLLMSRNMSILEQNIKELVKRQFI
jgi:hypothetical protein